MLGTSLNWPYAYAFPGLAAILLVVVLPFVPRSPRHLLLSEGDGAGARLAIADCVRGDDEQDVCLCKFPT